VSFVFHCHCWKKKKKCKNIKKAISINSNSKLFAKNYKKLKSIIGDHNKAEGQKEKTLFCVGAITSIIFIMISFLQKKILPQGL
jgi:hypothetical protein